MEKHEKGEALKTRRCFLTACALATASTFVPFARAFGEEKQEKSDEISTVLKKNLSLKVDKLYQRDTESFTQGLLYERDPEIEGGALYESGGQYGKSLLRKVEAETGRVLRKRTIPDKYFAEGLALVDDRLYMLTWREQRCLVFDKETFKQLDEFKYRGEGWGLAYDGEFLAMSDGSAKVKFLDVETFKTQRTVTAHYKTASGERRQINYLNELEFVEGELWANVYTSPYIVRLNPKTGELIGTAMNFSRWIPPDLKDDYERVLNGIAYDSERKRVFITGKRWPITYVFSLQ